MANFTAADVKKLRELTGAGMMDCKKALDEADGDFDKAVEILRIKGAKVAKRGAERAATQRPRRRRRGRADRAQLRDRLRRQERAVPDARRRHRRARRRRPGRRDVDDAARRDAGRRPDRRRRDRADRCRRHRREARAPPGRRPRRHDGGLPAPARPPTCPRRSACWCSSTATTPRPPAARPCRSPRCNPPYLHRDEVPADVVETERRIAEATAREEGKPEAALPKIVEGRVNGFFKDNVLLEQASVRRQEASGRARRGRRDVTGSPGSRSAGLTRLSSSLRSTASSGDDR